MKHPFRHPEVFAKLLTSMEICRNFASFLGVSYGGVALPGFGETGEVHGGVLKLVCWCAVDVIVGWLFAISVHHCACRREHRCVCCWCVIIDVVVIVMSVTFGSREHHWHSGLISRSPTLPTPQPNSL